jgi:formamidopyrimidine-DNA glycosylase
VPELPEVETVRRGLAAHVVGRRIERVEIGRQRTVRRTSPEAVVDGLTGTTAIAADRRGKYLLLPLDSGDTLMIHLRMTGRVLLADPGSPRPPHTHVVLHLAAFGSGTGRSELWFVDPRTFGEVVVFEPEHVAEQVPELARMGLDPLVDVVDRRVLRRLLATRSRAMKALLLDQHVIAGIGNIYADEILHAAKIRWDRRSDSLTAREVGRLHDAMHSILAAAVEAGGSTLADTQYVDLMGAAGSYQLAHRVYDRAGQPCLTCGRARVERVVVNGRTTSFCPRCQR